MSPDTKTTGGKWLSAVDEGRSRVSARSRLATHLCRPGQPSACRRAAKPGRHIDRKTSSRALPGSDEPASGQRRSAWLSRTPEVRATSSRPRSVKPGRAPPAYRWSACADEDGASGATVNGKRSPIAQAEDGDLPGRVAYQSSRRSRAAGAYLHDLACCDIACYRMVAPPLTRDRINSPAAQIWYRLACEVILTMTRGSQTAPSTGSIRQRSTTRSGHVATCRPVCSAREVFEARRSARHGAQPSRKHELSARYRPTRR